MVINSDIDTQHEHKDFKYPQITETKEMELNQYKFRKSTDNNDETYSRKISHGSRTGSLGKGLDAGQNEEESSVEL